MSTDEEKSFLEWLSKFLGLKTDAGKEELEKKYKEQKEKVKKEKNGRKTNNNLDRW